MTNFITRFNNNIAFLEILGDSNDENDYFVEFVDLNTNNVEYTTSIKVNHWSQIPDIFDKNISIRVKVNDELVFERIRNDKFNRVFILFGSNALGDTIGWIPYVEEYRKINNVEVILHTKYNYLFDKAYPNIIFTDISDSNLINNVDKKFKIDYGPELYYINNKPEPDKWIIENKKYDNFVSYFDYRKISLQSIAALILGLPTDEIKSEINIPENTESKIKGKYVVVAIQSTAQLKYWNNPFGWERLFDFFGRNGYKVVLIDKFKSFGIINHFNKAPKSKYVIDKTGNYSLDERIIDIKHADMMITISSGLAWLSWAVGTPVVMISGFTKPWNEFKSNNVRIYNSNVCNGCWNDSNVTFDPSNWLFCPKKQDFICSKSILPKDVTDAVKKYMK
jgi:autotransporter strand-loop-strand O-heptosyltransferase